MFPLCLLHTHIILNTITLRYNPASFIAQIYKNCLAWVSKSRQKNLFVFLVECVFFSSPTHCTPSITLRLFLRRLRSPGLILLAIFWEPLLLFFFITQVPRSYFGGKWSNQHNCQINNTPVQFFNKYV